MALARRRFFPRRIVMNYDPWSPRAANYDELRRLPCLLMMMNYDEGLADGFLVSYYDDEYDPPDPSLKSRLVRSIVS